MEWILYIPDFDGNREVKTEDQISVEILPLTVRESRRIAGSITAKRVKGGSFKTNQAELSMKSLNSHVRNIKNLQWNGKDITTPEELLDTPYVELADELEAAMQNASVIDEGNVKNLRSQSPGALKRTPIPGTAENANPIGKD